MILIRPSSHPLEYHGTFMGLRLGLHGTPMVFPWVFRGAFMGLHWRFFGTPNGASVGISRDSYGTLMVPSTSRGSATRLPWDFHGASVRLPSSKIGLPRGASMGLPLCFHGSSVVDSHGTSIEQSSLGAMFENRGRGGVV